MPRIFAAALCVVSLSFAGASRAAESEPRTTVCELIESAALESRLSVDFFTRLIWQESGFRADAVSPKGAEGIAQFMPGTASLRGLSDSFDPKEAIPASAKYLSALAARFGNLGLAAAAYNAGEKRLDDWIGRSGRLPLETEDYVLTITGRTAEEWLQQLPNVIAGATPPAPFEKANCLLTAALLSRPGAGSDIVASIPKAPRAPWGVQIAGGFSLNRAMASYRTIQKKYAAIVGDSPPMVLRSVVRSRGRAPLFHLRLPSPSREAAEEICRRLQKAGGACVVLKT